MSGAPGFMGSSIGRKVVMAVTGFGIGHDYRGMEGVAERSAFLVDGDGIIRGTWQYEPGQVPDFDELLAAARSLS